MGVDRNLLEESASMLAAIQLPDLLSWLVLAIGLHRSIISTGHVIAVG